MDIMLLLITAAFVILHSSSVNALAGNSKPSSQNSKKRKVDFALQPSISDIPAESWNSCLAPDGSSSPFLEHAWLQCLEESGCASPQTGWVPQHVCIKIDGSVGGYVPLYAKAHSMGEFIFDNAWAEAAYQNGINYYPKLLVGVPFTPATGGRILLHPIVRETFSKEEISQLRIMVGGFLKRLAEANRISSVHLNFVTDEEANDLAGELSQFDSGEAEDSATIKEKVKSVLKQLQKNERNGYLRRTSLQYHWTNRNANNENRPYKSFEDYLQSFKSKKRINIKRERRKVKEDENIRVDVVSGRDILKYDGLVKRMFEIYLSTVDKLFYGRQYLSLDFFMRLSKSDFVKNLCFMCARNSTAGEELRAEDVFAGTFNVVKDGVFYGRYWGSLPGMQVKNLHFETCYWSAIEYCIKHGLKRMEPGAGGGDYKWGRGFDPALIHSAHYICHPGLRRAIRQFVAFETENNVEVSEYLMKRSVVGTKAFTGDGAALRATS